MLCPDCGGETPDGRRFCANCGRPLGSSCASCGAELLPGKAFCADCGTAIASVAPPAQRQPAVSDTHEAEPVAERRVCSVLFVDLVGFTPLAERRDPEEVRELLSIYYDRAGTIIRNYGGTVEKFIGDAVMAVFGAPVANEDDAERAVRAGLDVVASVAELGREAQIPELAARGGVVTGEVAITIGKVAEGMVLGDTVNSASRVQSAAEPGTVLVDESTWHAAARAIAFAEVGALSLKGKAEPVQAWRALRVVARRQGIGRSEGLEPPFVGRDAELRAVKGQLHATMSEARARLVSVTGVPGIGKSRLGWEFLKYVDGLADTVFWHQGRSPAYGEGITFWALGEMVRMRAGISDTDDAETTRSKLAASVADFSSDPAERRWLEPRLGHLLGLAESASRDRDELFSAWRTFFERVAEQGPTVMVFEDLQWADPGLIDFIESILEWSARHPILVVTLARPELADHRPTWGAGQRSFTSLHLEPLAPKAMGELLDGFVHGLPGALRAKVLERSEGIPLYAVEIVRALVDRGALVESEGAYGIVGDLSSFEIPETLQALIGSRLDALAAGDRALLQDAAILGTTFSADALAVVAGADRATIEVTLRDLVRKEFLSVEMDPRSPDRGNFAFVQALIREVAASRLARRDRRAKHLAVARHFESLEDDELAGAVATHYLEAYRADREAAEAEDLRSSAREWLLRAGGRAESLGSPEQALAFFKQALEVTAEGVDRAEVLELVGDAAAAAARPVEALESLESALAIYEAADSPGVGRTSLKIVLTLVQQRHFSEALRRGRAAYAAANGTDVPLRAELAGAISGAVAGSSPGDALAWSETALALAEQLDDPALFATMIGYRAGALFNLGRHREATLLGRGMAALADEVGVIREQARARLQLSVFMLDEDPGASIDTAVEGAELARRAGIRALETVNWLNAAEAAAYIGRWDDAIAAIRRVSDWELRSDQRLWITCIEALLAAATGDPARADSLLAPHDDEVSTNEDVSIRTTFRSARAMVHLSGGDYARAAEDARAAVAEDPHGINTPKCLDILARACLWLGDADGVRFALESMRGFTGRWMAAGRKNAEAGLAALAGDLDEASALFSDALERLRALDATFELALAELDLVKMLGPDHPEAKVAHEARGIFARLGARPFLLRLDELAPED